MCKCILYRWVIFHGQLLICLLVCRCWRIFSTCWWSPWGSSAAFVPLDQSAVGGFPSCTRSCRWRMGHLGSWLHVGTSTKEYMAPPHVFFVVYLKFTSFVPVSCKGQTWSWYWPHVCHNQWSQWPHKLDVPWWCPAMIANHSLARGWSSKMPGNFQRDFVQEKIYPIHVAAKLGKCDILRIWGGNCCSDFRNIVHQ